MSVCVFLTSCTWTRMVSCGVPTCQEEYLLAVRHRCQACAILRVSLGWYSWLWMRDKRAWKYVESDEDACRQDFPIIWMMLKRWNFNSPRENNRFMVSGINVAIEYYIWNRCFPGDGAKKNSEGVFPMLFWLDFVDAWVIHVCETLVRYATRSIHTSTPRKIAVSGWIHYQDEWYLELSSS